MSRRFPIILLVLFVFLNGNVFARGSRGFHRSSSGYHSTRSSHSYRSHSFGSHKIHSTSSYHPRTSYHSKSTSHYSGNKSTYTIGRTRYISGERYKTTGMAKVVRSQAAKRQFLKSKGLTRIPKGYQIDHIKPLSQGGKDEPSNMQLLSTKDHQRKTASERRRH